MRNALGNFGNMVFDSHTMRERLPKDVFEMLQETVVQGRSLNPSIANAVANAMKNWAMEKGVTHYTHWFQPMTGVTAEKHDSFISLAQDGGILTEFSGKELIKGEPDASSFPSGGLRATFEARGYTAWDPTSYAFIKGNTLCIPTSFYSFSGDALDKKTPLLRSAELIARQVRRVLALLGRNDIKSVIATVGPEQEYFLVDKELAKRRRDLMYCGRTLLGAKSPKGQEMDDHYYGAIRPRVQAFMQELNEELWKLGVLAKTEHNETAPAQHELAPIYTAANVATDHNQLTMEMMKKIADRHGMLCLLHEKPFAGVNGSGKHNNWSLSADHENLLDPGDTPSANTQFLLFLAAVIQAVDEHQDLLRVSVASAGNDCRLGTGEAPPAVLSIFLGDDITALLDSIEKGVPHVIGTREPMRSGIHTAPRFEKDTTDRNRTSPFAFTGNKFEFRMVGSAFSIAGPNFVLNTVVADALSSFADALEAGENPMDIVRHAVVRHKRILFNGNNYSKEWEDEAGRRGLLNLRGTVDALPYFLHRCNIDLFSKYGILNEAEMLSRYEILMGNYCKTIRIEALTLSDMIRKDIIPAAVGYAGQLSQDALQKRGLCPELSCAAERALVSQISVLTDRLYETCGKLDAEIVYAQQSASDIVESANRYQQRVLPAMQDVRMISDELETMVGEDAWPIPTYGQLMFSV